jgi:hypothetical protein
MKCLKICAGAYEMVAMLDTLGTQQCVLFFPPDLDEIERTNLPNAKLSKA